jgi:hypothetical protein
VINALVAPAGLGVPIGRRGRLGLNWVGDSLLASLTTMLLEDLSQGVHSSVPAASFSFPAPIKLRIVLVNVAGVSSSANSGREGQPGFADSMFKSCPDIQGRELPKDASG